MFSVLYLITACFSDVLFHIPQEEKIARKIQTKIAVTEGLKKKLKEGNVEILFV